MLLSLLVDFFFFQAEDGIRDLTVTGVQTCALPISLDNGSIFPVATTTRARSPRSTDASLEGSMRSEEHTSELQSQSNLVCRLLLEKKKIISHNTQPNCNLESSN